MSYKKISPKIEQIILDTPKTPKKKLAWLNINNAGAKEIKYLRKNYKFSLDHLRASVGHAKSYRTILQKTDDYLFVILHFPVFVKDNIEIKEIEFFFDKKYLISIHNNVKDINNFFNLIKKDQKQSLAFASESPRVLLYEILEKLMLSSFNLLDKTTADIKELEQIIFAQEQKEAVSRILTIRRNIINFRRTMQNHTNIIQKIMNVKNTRLIPNQHIKEYYNNLLDYSRRIWNILEGQKEIIEVLNSTNESLINYRLNLIMKTLTIFSVIIFPLTLLSALFGMNVTGSMPFIHSPFGFWFITAIMLAGAIIMLIYFKKKKWL